MSEIKSIFDTKCRFNYSFQKLTDLSGNAVTHHFVRRLIGFVICCDRVHQQKHRRQRQQVHHRDFVRNEGHFLILRFTISLPGNVYKDHISKHLSRADCGKQIAQKRCYSLTQKLCGIFQLLKHFLSFRKFKLKL